MKYLILILIIFALTESGCSSATGETEFVFGKGKYKFVMKDSSGVTLAKGKLNVKNYSGGKISGTYEFTYTISEDFDGYSSMNGEFEGDINTTDKIVFINTNPRIADSNVFWRLKINKSNLSGSWTYSVFRGRSTGGTVKITK